MITLQTIRDKAGVLVSVIIGIALLAFIVNADTLSFATSVFSGKKNEVGIIDGKSISYQDFYERLNYNTEIYKLMYKLFAGREAPMSEDDNARLRDQTWSDLFQQIVLEKEYSALGLTVSVSELVDLMSGDEPSPVVVQYFGDQTGRVDKAIINNIIQQTEVSDELRIFWVDLEDKTRVYESGNKITILDEKSKFVNSLDMKRITEAVKYDVQLGYAWKDYNLIPDSVVTVTSSDLKKYYDNHKHEFEQTEGRDMQYVEFAVTPSADDYQKTSDNIVKLSDEMQAADIADLPQFVNLNSEKPFDNIYRKQGELPVEIDSAAFAAGVGEMLPYYQIGDTYYASRILEFKNIPDSVKAEHILLDFQNPNVMEEADSLINLIEGGANFADIAKENSKDEVANLAGGDLGWFTFDRMVRPFSDSCFYHPKGKPMKVVTQFGVHIVRVTDTKDEKRKIKLATVQSTVVPGKDTYSRVYAAAGKIATESQKDIKKFEKLVADEGLQMKTESNITIGAKTIGNHTGVGELTRWLYDAKKNEVSGVLEIDDRNTFVVAALTAIKKKGTAPFEQMRSYVETQVRIKKKSEIIAEDFTKAMADESSIDGFAAKTATTVFSTSNPINFNASYIQGLMVSEPALVAAAVSSPENKLSGPVIGNGGVYVFTVTEKIERDVNIEQQKMILKSRMSQFFPVINEKADITDNRGKFF